MTKSELDSLLRYDRLSGVFYWKVSRGRIVAGAQAGTDDGKGYVGIRINKKQYKAHKLAWLTVTGIWPAFQLDHRDTNRANNRFENLRPATQLQNTYNRSLSSNNKSGVKGVHWHANSGKWRATIGVDGRKIQLGLFETIPEAKAVIDLARKSYHKSFARKS